MNASEVMICLQTEVGGSANFVPFEQFIVVWQ
jgi:hypothetical protein